MSRRYAQKACLEGGTPGERVERDGDRQIQVTEEGARPPTEIPVVTSETSLDERFLALAESSRDAVAELSAEGKLLYLSPAFSELTGHPPSVIDGSDPLALVHAEDRPEVERLGREALRASAPAQLRFRYRHWEGDWRWIEVAVRPHRSERGEPRVLLVSRELADARLRGQLEAERRIALLSRRLLQLEADDFEEGLYGCLEAAAQLAGAQRAQFYVLQGEGQEVGHYEWSEQDRGSRDPAELDAAAQRFRWTARQLLEGRHVHIPDTAALPPEADPEREKFTRDGVLAYLLLPIMQGGRAVGFMDFRRSRPGEGWTQAEISRLRLVAELFTNAVRRLRAERKRRESEQRLRVLAAQLKDTICELGEDGRILYLSPNAEELCGFSRRELEGDGLWNLVHPQDRARTRQHIDDALAEDREIETLTYRIQHRDGSWRWLEATVRGFRNDAAERRLAIAVRDVTERQETRLELERRLELESRIADFSRVLLECDTERIEAGIERGLGLAGQLAGADRAFLVTALGEGGARPRAYDWALPGTPPRLDPVGLAGSRRQDWVRDQLIRGAVVQIERVEDMPPSARGVRASLLEEGIRSYLVLPILSDERLAGVLGFHCLRQHRRWSTQDLTILRLIADLFTSALRRKRAESKLRENQVRLLQAQKMEAIGTLAGGIAHDFNNQLTVMLANARYVRSELPTEDGEVGLALDDVTRAAEHCAQLTRSLLAFSRRSSVSTRALDASEELAKALELLRPLVPSSIRFEAAAEPDLGWVVADATQLQQVLVNLVVNARDAMGSGGTLTLRAARRRLERAEADRLGLSRDGPYLEFQVADTGPGMDEEVRSRIFEPFFTTKPVGQGTGLGLATAYGIVQQAHGAITVHSEPGRGSTFCVYLPEALEHEARDLATDAIEEECGSGTVLLAEDEQSVRRITARMLRAAGYEVLLAEDGGEALRLGRQHAARLSALVTDLEMPELDGIELARRLARQRPDLPVVFISGTAPEGGAGDAFGMPVRHGCFVPKPFTGPQLLSALHELIDRVDG